MADTGWRRNKYGGWFNINDSMNNKIRNIKDYDGDEGLFEYENQNVLYENQSLTEQQKNVIREYTNEDGYGSNEIINRYLNGEKELSEGAVSIVNQKIQVLESSITQPLNRDIYVYRGIKGSPKDLAVGSALPNKGFTSTSISRYDASNFGIGTGTTVKIRVKRGTKALYIGKHTSASHNEHELLFGQGKQIKIVKVEKLFDKDGDFMNYEVLGELI